MIAVVSFDGSCPPGNVATALAARDLAWQLVDAVDSLPSVPSAVVVLGGPQAAHDEAANPHFVVVKTWLRGLVAEGTPVLGLCLGSQLVADALGGSAHPAPRPEVGLVELEVDVDDPLVPFLAGKWIFVHEDTFSVPEGARVIARSAYPAAYRAGSAVGLQFHPEADPGIVAGWMTRVGGAATWPGVDAESFLAEVHAAAVDLVERGAGLIGAWLDQSLLSANPHQS